jgi:CBS domain-containing protein
MPKSGPIALQRLSSSLAAPRSGTWQVDLKDAARTVMTDFKEVRMVTVLGETQVDEALEIMRHAGVRSAFVVDKERQKVLGFITAYDIMGEKPLRFLQTLGGNQLTTSREEVLVRDIMESVQEWQVARLEDVDQATVGSMLEAFQRTGLTHIGVVETAEGEGPRLRGVFSSAKLLRLTEESRKAASRPVAAAG